MLNDDEWERIRPLLSLEIHQRQDLSREGITGEALAKHRGPACRLFEEMTGFRETNVNAIWHHQNTLLGPDCENCGKPYRTPKARFCAACGSQKQDLIQEV